MVCISEVSKSCIECESTNFYSDFNKNSWCVECGEPHKSNDFSLITTAFQDDYDIFSN